MKNCPNCGTTVHDDVAGCPECGGRWAADGSFVPPAVPVKVASTIMPSSDTPLADITAGQMERLIHRAVVDVVVPVVVIAVFILVSALLSIHSPNGAG
jgi:uncharacterized membrane protein YvbJ